MRQDLNQAAQQLKLLAESTRLRLICLLHLDELTVAELAASLQLAQPRVSTHLARLKDAGLVCDRRAGVSSYYRLPQPWPEAVAAIIDPLLGGLSDPLLADDRRRLQQVLQQRSKRAGWVDEVAGDMERHYSPGRTWEATARAVLRLLKVGTVLDIASGDGVLAELLAARAKQVTCVDISERAVAAGRKRLADYDNTRFEQADMHQLPFKKASFDLVLAMQALTYAERPSVVLAEVARVLRPGGRLLITTLKRHGHETVVTPFGHVNLGFETQQLRALAQESQLSVETCEITSREGKPPHFEVITLVANKP